MSPKQLGVELKHVGDMYTQRCVTLYTDAILGPTTILHTSINSTTLYIQRPFWGQIQYCMNSTYTCMHIRFISAIIQLFSSKSSIQSEAGREELLAQFLK